MSARDTHDADNISCLWQQLDIYDAIKMCDLFVRRKAYASAANMQSYTTKDLHRSNRLYPCDY